MVHVITRLELGGAQLATLHACAHSQFAAAPRVLMVGPGGMLDAEAAAIAGLEMLPIAALGRAIDPGDDARALSQLRRALLQLRRAHPGRRLMVHTHSSKAGILGRLAAAMVGAERVVHSIHGFGHHPHMVAPLRRALWLAEYTAARVTHGFTADSAANLERARAEALIRRQPAAVVHCGIDVARFATPETPRAAMRRRLGLDDSQLVVLQLACLKPQKNPLAIVRVAAALKGHLPQARYLVAGDGPLRPALTHLSRRLGVQEEVRLLGWRRDVPELLHACDLLVLPSLWEGLPQVFAQAMAAGRAIVATDVDGAPEAVRHGDNGLLVPPRDDVALAAAIAELLVDAPRRAAMGAWGQAHVAPFSQAAMVRDLDAFYRRVTENLQV